MRRVIDKALGWTLIILMSVMVLDVLWQIASRYLLGSPSLFTDELAGFLLIWVGLLGAAYTAGKKKHLAISILPDKLEGTEKRILSVIIFLLTLLFVTTVMVIGGARLVYITLDLQQYSATLGIPLGFVYIVIPLSGALIAYYSISDFINISK